MKTFTGYVGVLREGMDASIGFLQGQTGLISDAFRDGSQRGSGGSDFSVKLNFDRYTKYAIPRRQTTQSLHLHRASNRILSREPRGWNLKEMAILYSDNFAPRPDMFGLMFDTGFSGNSQQKRIPRQGCSIFLDPIAAVRKGEEFQREVLFTTIHEIGHIFNLWHTRSPASFMSSSRKRAIYPPGAFQFHDQHKNYLRQCTRSRYVHPGGSKFGKRNGQGPNEGTNFNDPVSDTPLSLALALDQESAHYFEPLELDISIRNTSLEKRASFPDQLDPGYSRFDLWIERPSGELGRYLPTKHFCDNHRRLRLQPGERYIRDISIFGQSGGYTFAEPGKYRVTAVFQLNRNSTLRSNTVEIEISTDKDHPVAEFFLDRDVAQKLFYRTGTVSKRQIATLKQLATHARLGMFPSLWNTHYAFGKILANRVLSQASSSRKRDGEIALALLDTCAENISPDTSRYLHLERLINELR